MTVEMKICTKCKKEKTINEFRFIQNTQKYNANCIDCEKEYNKEYRIKNKDKIIQDRKIYYEENKNIILEDRKQYQRENKEDIKIYQKEYRKEYYKNNKENISEINSKYYQENKLIIIIKNNKNQKKRRKRDPIFKLRRNISSAILAALKKCDSNKNGRSITHFLQYSIEELKEHLEKQFEPWMTWDNHGNYNKQTWDDNNPNTWTWQIDHIIPQSDLPFISMEDDNFKKCWTLVNLRPLSAKQNQIDGVKRLRHKI